MQEHIQRLMRRVQHMVGVGRTTAVVNDTGAAQTVQIQGMSGTPDDEVKVHPIFGLSSSMPVGSDVTFVAIAGDSSARIAIATGHQPSRPKNTPVGGTTLYDQVGTALQLTNDGNAALTLTGTFTIKIGSMMAVFSATGLAVTGGVIAGLGTADQVTLQHHTHPTAAIGGPSMPTPGT